MKRVMRDVIDIITTIRWLPDEPEQHPLAQVFLPQEARSPADEVTETGEAAPILEGEALYVVCYTYLIAYRLLDDTQ